MLFSGDYALIIRGKDDVSDGQVCRILAPDESEAYHRYQDGDAIPALCWTGYLVWTTHDNLIKITGENGRIDDVFRFGHSRTGSVTLQF